MKQPDDDNDNETDRLLQEWGMSKRPEPARVEALRAGIMRVLEEETESRPVPSGNKPIPQSPPATDKRSWMLGIGAAISVAVLVALAVSISSWDRSSDIEPGDTDTSLASFNSQELQNRNFLFQEIDTLYEGRVRWVAEANGEIEVGLGEEVQDGSSGPIAVRLVLMERDILQDKWVPCDRFDLVLRSDEVLEMSLPYATLNQLTVWTHRLPDGAVMVDANFGSETKGLEELRTTNVFTEEHPHSTQCTELNGQQLKLSQVVAVVD